jgi:hypothetical protein
MLTGSNKTACLASMGCSPWLGTDPEICDERDRAVAVPLID